MAVTGTDQGQSDGESRPISQVLGVCSSGVSVVIGLWVLVSGHRVDALLCSALDG
jgi:hypothetical protein